MAQGTSSGWVVMVAPVLVVATGLVAGYVVGGATGLLIAVGVSQVVLLAAVLLTWRSAQLAAQRRHRESSAGQRRLHARAQALVRVVHRGERRLTEAVAEGLTSLGTRQARRQQLAVNQVQAALGRQFTQLEALTALYYGIQPGGPIPPTRGWAASPDLLRYLYQVVMRRRPRLVLECGSGVSTLVFGYAMKALGVGQVVALEHDPRHAEATRGLLGEHGLAGWAEVRAAPLAPVEVAGETWRWYEPSALPPGPVDLLFVDGPPGRVGPLARFPAVPVLADRLAPDGLVVLDDHDRGDEREVAQRWLRYLPGWVTERVDHEKGTAVLRGPDSSDQEKS